MRLGGAGAHRLARIGDEILDRHRLIDDAVDERGVGAVFEQASHQIRQQILVAADRCVDAAGYVELVGADDFAVQVGAHAVQALVFERPPLREVVDRGDRVRIVGGELRVDVLAADREHAPGAGQIGHVGVGLARIHRIADQTLLLRALDLGVPVRTLDQPHAPATTGAARGLRQPVDHVGAALLVGLHGQAKPVPAGQRLVGEHGADDFQRQFEPVGLLGVDGHADAAAHGQLRQLEQLGRQLGMYPSALGDLVARVQRRQLDRDRRRVDHALERAARAERDDRVLVRAVVTLGVGLGQCRFAEHVVGIAVVAVALLCAAIERLADIAAHHELVAHDAHRLAHGEADHRFAGAPDQALEAAGEVAAGILGEIDQAPGQHEAPGRCVDQHRFAATEMFLPVGLAELVADQLVGGGLVGDAQQRLGHAHEQHTFLAGQVVLAHERFDHALLAGAQAYARDELGRTRQHQRAFGRRQAGLVEQFLDGLGFIARPGCGDTGPGGVGRGRQFG